MDPTISYTRDHLNLRDRKFFCNYCSRVFTRYRAFDKHSEDSHMCRFCGEIFADLTQHACLAQPRQELIGGLAAPFLPQNLELGQFEFIRQAHMGTISVYKHTYTQPVLYVKEGFRIVKSDLVHLLNQFIDHFQNIKCRFILTTRMVEVKSQIEKDLPTATPLMNILHKNFVEKSLSFVVDFITTGINLYNENASGYGIDGLVSLEIHIGQLRQIPVGAYIPTPKVFRFRHGLLNIRTKNKENCFELCVLAHCFEDMILQDVFPGKTYDQLNHQERLKLKYQQGRAQSYEALQNYVDSEKLIDFEGFKASVKLEEIDTFEINNKISINVYGHLKSSIHPLRLTKMDFPEHINLLMLKDANLPPDVNIEKWKNQKPIYHFVLITNLHTFLSPGNNHKTEYCKWCLRRCTKNLIGHQKKCREAHEAGIRTKKEGERFKFKPLHMKFDQMYYIFYDFEAYNIKSNKPPPKVNPKKLSYTHIESNFEVSAFGIVVSGPDPKPIFQYYYGDGDKDVNIMDEFFRVLFFLEKEIPAKLRRDYVECKVTEEEMARHILAERCAECKRFFTHKNKKCLHHHHYIADFPVQTLCLECNFAIVHKKFVPCIAHNSTHFDLHFIIRSLKKKHQLKVTRIIPKNTQHFLSISLGSIRFLDSFNFLSSSLDKLITRLKGSGTAEEMIKFQPFREGFDNHPDVDMLFKKGIFPYDWNGGPEKLKHTSLPPKEAFYSNLREEGITDEEYEHACNVFRTFKCTTFRDYMILYVKQDTLLLCCAFKAFVASCMDIYKLSPCHSYSLAGFTYHAAMYSLMGTETQRWEYITDVDLFKLLRDNVRGGMCYVTKRFSKSISERLGDINVKDKDRQEILYVDQNALYSNCLSMPLPHSKYRRLEEHELINLDVMKLPVDSGEGWIFVVDMDYDPKLHKSHNDLPLCPNKERVDPRWLSPLQKHLKEIYKEELSNPLGSEKLLLTLGPKREYGAYYKLLQLYVKLGMKITKIHRVYTFKEKFIFRDFIRKNIELRKQATDEFTSTMYKLFNNAIFGKTLNVRAGMTVKFSNSRVDSLEYLSAHNLKDVRILNEDSCLFFFEGSSVLINKPYAIGQTCLDLSKLIMYDTFYSVLKPKFGSRITQMYMDTDSYVLEIRDPNKTYIQDLRSLDNFFDYSNLAVDHPLFSKQNEGVPGKLKIVHDNIREFVGLTAKVYSLLFACTVCKDNTDEVDKCAKCSGTSGFELKGKGIPKIALKRFNHQVFRDTLLNEGVVFGEFRRIQSSNHVVSVVKASKVMLHNLDMKRHLLEGGIESLAYGHTDIKLE